MGLPSYIASMVANAPVADVTWRLDDELGQLSKISADSKPGKPPDEFPLGESEDKGELGRLHKTITLEGGRLQTITKNIDKEFPGGTMASSMWLAAEKTMLVEWNGFDGHFYFARVYSKI